MLILRQAIFHHHPTINPHLVWKKCERRRRTETAMNSHNRVLYFAAAASLALLCGGVVNGMVGNPSTSRIVLSILITTLGSSILFPVLVSFAYDRLRERWMGDEIWRIFTELADGGIIRVYRDREHSEHADNAESRLKNEFNTFSSGELRMIGVSLRVFFNQMGVFYPEILTMLNRSKGAVKIMALISSPESPEVKNRGLIESKSKDSSYSAQIVRDIESTIVSVKNLLTDAPQTVALREYLEAPYCTAIIFPDKCYFSPNILCPMAPVRLPMIVFRAGSLGYTRLKQSFDYIWSTSKPITPEVETDHLVSAVGGSQQSTVINH